MNKVVLVAGASGFVGQSVLRQAKHFQELTIIPLVRERAAEQVQNARSRSLDAEISLLNLSWPSMQKYSSSTDERHETNDEWELYERWLYEIVDVAAGSDVRFFQIGSGIERYAKTEPPSITDPYLTYAKRKEKVWRRVQSTMPATSWRLLLHFLFGIGESGRRVVPSAIRACLSGELMTVGAPSRRRCWLDIDDAAHGLLTATASQKPENWDICGSISISFDELFLLIGEATGRGANIAASEGVVADANCPLVAPRNPAPFIRAGAGDPDYLRSRLIEYARIIAS